jgi:hypothetical protein
MNFQIWLLEQAFSWAIYIGFASFWFSQRNIWDREPEPARSEEYLDVTAWRR